jgi:chromosome segregation ATPase
MADSEASADAIAPVDLPYRSPAWWRRLQETDPTRWAQEIELDDNEKARGIKPRGQVETLREQIEYLKGKHNGLVADLKELPELFDALQEQISNLHKDLNAVKASIPNVEADIGKTIDERIAAAEARVTLDLEREFGAALARGPGPTKDIEQRATRTAEHVQRLETRVQKLEKRGA